MLIFPILNHRCFGMVYYYLFGVISLLVNYYFQVSFSLNVTLYIAKYHDWATLSNYFES